MHQDYSEYQTREVPLKQWIHEEMQRAHVGYQAIWYRLRRNKKVKYPGIQLRNVNSRVVFVREELP